MTHQQSWDWDPGNRVVADVSELRTQYEDVHEFAVSADGEKIAVPVVKERPDTLGVWVNGELWEGEYEKAWQLRFTPDGRLVALVRADDEWTVAVDGIPWEETFDFVWDLTISPDGSAIVVKAKQEPRYTMVRNGEPWGETFLSIRDHAVSADGKTVAATGFGGSIRLRPPDLRISQAVGRVHWRRAGAPPGRSWLRFPQRPLLSRRSHGGRRGQRCSRGYDHPLGYRNGSPASHPQGAQGACDIGLLLA